MKETPVPMGNGTPSVQECRELVERILASSCFRRTNRLRSFLLHVTDCALGGHPEGASEIAIGCQVFGRQPNYNPGEDNIVRSEARQLRVKLELYFQTEGKDEPLVLSVPKGTYLPVFTARAPETAETNGAPRALGAPEPLAAASRGRRWSQPVMLALLAVLVLFCGLLLWKSPVLVQVAAARAPRNFVWDRMFDTSHETTIVVADSSIMEFEDLAQKALSLDEYMGLPGRAFDDPDPAKRNLMARIASRQLTSVADVVLTAGIVRESDAYDSHTGVKFARKADLRDFKGRNDVVLLGSSRSNPWVYLFEGSMNFRFEYDPATRRSSIRNLAPRAGETALYTAAGGVTQPGETYGVIALLPNLTGDGNVLMIAGATMEGTEAAGELLLHAQYSQQLLEALRKNGIPQSGHFEALLRTRAGEGTSRDTQVLACRPLPDRLSAGAGGR